jgi:hypothetical protein
MNSIEIKHSFINLRAFMPSLFITFKYNLVFFSTSISEILIHATLKFDCHAYLWTLFDM